MRIVFIIDSLRRHGAQHFLVQLVRGLQARGYEQTVISLNRAAAPEIEHALAAAGCRISYIGRAAFLCAGFGWWQLVRRIKRARPGVVMTLLDFADTLGRPAARLARCRVIITSLRVRNLVKPLWRRLFDRMTMPLARKVVLNSGEFVAYARQKEGVSQDQVVVIHNGVDDLRGRSSGTREATRRELQLDETTRLIGAVGRLYPQKNFPVLLQAVAALKTSQPWKLLIIGAGPEKERLIHLADQLKIASSVVWLGERDDVERWLAALDIFVHPSSFEGMPNAVLEAMASALPVVASDVDGTRDLIVPNRTGFLLPPRDVDGFAREIDRLLADPELRVKMGEAAYRHVREKFTLDRMIDQYDQLFRSLAPNSA